MGATVAFERSSNIHSISYDPETLTLAVSFKNHEGQKTSTWEYSGCSISVWDDFRVAQSPGKFFQAHVKGKYVGRQVS